MTPRVANGGASRVIQLDVLRGIAILLVLGAHSVLTPADGGHLRNPIMLWFRFGWTGVDLFFVLSGFLVGGLLMQEFRQSGRIGVLRFLIRRGFKIWPSYYAYLAITALVLYPLTGRAIPSWQLMWPGLIHLQNYLGTPFGHTWSLGVEEHFYLFLPPLVVAVAWTGSRRAGGNRSFHHRTNRSQS